jgi:hypothetical protein
MLFQIDNFLVSITERFRKVNRYKTGGLEQVEQLIGRHYRVDMV